MTCVCSWESEGRLGIAALLGGKASEFGLHAGIEVHFPRYGGRYVRRPPIAQYHIQEITDNEVQFRRKVKIDGRKQSTTIRCSLQEFVSMLAQHVPDRYRHAVRHFGLLSPRTKAKSFTIVFALLGQKKRTRPRRLGWAFSMRRDFGVDPLSDANGERMRWAGRLSSRL